MKTRLSTVYSNDWFDGLDDVVYDSLNESVSLFKDLPEMKPTLKDALEDIGLSNETIKSTLKESKFRADKARKDPIIAACGLSDDEAGAIFCYTHDLGGGKAMYEFINESLAVYRNSKSLSATRKFIYLLLSGLRKLPPISPTTKKVYRGIKVSVPTTLEEATDEKTKKVHQHYEEGRTVTLWGFTSTTADFGAVNRFIKGAPESTLFMISGEPLWGYDISAFSLRDEEKEILFEPETRIVVDKVVKQGATGKILLIEATLQKSDFVLKDVIPFKDETRKLVSANWDFRKSVWEKCPDEVDEKRKYVVRNESKRIATKFVGGFWNFWGYCTIIGDKHLPPNAVTSWSVKILKSRTSDGYCIEVGVAPSDINQNEGHNWKKCGWYFDCYESSLYSGPPHNYSGKEYGPRGKKGKYVQIGERVGIVMDTVKGELSFVVDGVNRGVAYEGIPLDKPLVPCVILYYENDSVELVF